MFRLIQIQSKRLIILDWVPFTAPQFSTLLGHKVTGYLHLLRVLVTPRLVDWLIHQPDPQVQHSTLGPAICGPSRLCLKQEIRTGPVSGYPVPQNLFTSGPRESFAPRVQSLGDSRLRAPSILPRSTNLLGPLGRLSQRPSSLSHPTTLARLTFSYLRNPDPFCGSHNLY